MRSALLGAAGLALTSLVSPLHAKDSGDDRLAALADEYYAYQVGEYNQVEEPDGSTEPGDRLWSVTPEAYRARADYAKKMLAKLEALDETSLSPAAKVDAAVLQTLLQEEIEDQIREHRLKAGF